MLEQCEEKIFLDGIFAGMLTYAEYIMQNAGLDEAHARIKISGRNINNLRYADDTTLTAENEEKLKSLLMKVKEESEKVGLKLSHSFMTTGKITALTRQTFIEKVIFLVFNMLSRFVIAFLPRSKHLLISFLQLPPAVILEPKKIKSLTVYIVSPSVCHEMMEPDAMILVF